MASKFKDVTIDSAGYLQIPAGTTNQRPIVRTVLDSFTNVQELSWTCPENVTSVEILVVAGGGGGGNAQVNSGTPGGGGGAGGVIYRPSHPVVPGETYTVSVGAGGSAGEISYNGSDGGPSFFGSIGSAVINDTFDSGTDGWTANNASIANVSSQLQITPDAGVNGGAVKLIDTVPGDFYVVKADVSGDTGAFARINIGYGTIAQGGSARTAYGGAQQLGNGSHEVVFQAKQEKAYINLEIGGGGQQVTTFDNVQVYRLNNALYAYGGGGGGGATSVFNYGRDGGSGGGSCGTVPGGAGLATQGNAGSAGGVRAGGGGGAGESGEPGYNVITGSGGNGLQFSITGSPQYYGGGGGAGGSTSGFSKAGSGGRGGGGNGASSSDASGAANGTDNTGGGGGGSAARGGSTSPAGNGGSGVVYIRYSYWDKDTTGDELITNGTFDTDLTGWSNDSPMLATVSNGQVLLDRNGGSSRGQLYQTITTEVGAIYEASVEISAFSDGVQIYADESSISPFAVNALGVHQYRFVASSTSTRIDVSAVQNTDATATIDNVSVKKIKVESADGLLRYNNEFGDIEVFENANDKWKTYEVGKNYSGHNYFENSQEFASGSWNTLNCTPLDNKHLAPDGTITAAVLPRTSSAVAHVIQQAFNFTDIRTMSVYAKSLLGGSLVLNAAGHTNHFDLTTGVITTINGAANKINAEMFYVGQGWYRCVQTGVGTGNAQQQIQPWAAGQTVNWDARYDAGDGDSGVIIWGAQQEDGAISTPYTFTGVGSSSEPPIYGNDYVVHRYTDTSEASFFTPAFSGEIEIFVVGGGGAGGSDIAGGGGGGGVVYIPNYKVTSGRSYKIEIGTGGVSAGTGGGIGYSSVQDGSYSRFGNVFAFGGGGGGTETSGTKAMSGGSGGGQGPRSTQGTGIIGQGNPGGSSPGPITNHPAGGGGGAGSAGQPGSPPYGGDGGSGKLCFIDGFYYGAGGGGGAYATGSIGGRGGYGGGGGGSAVTGRGGGSGGVNAGAGGNSTTSGGVGGAAGANTGSGGGGGGEQGGGGAGADGIVMIRYKR